MLYAPTAGHEQTPEFLKEFRAGSSMSCKLAVLLLELDPSPIQTFVPRYFSVPFFFKRSVLSPPESMVAFMIASMSVGPCNGLVKNALAPDAALRSRMPASSKAVMTIVGIFLFIRLR